MINNIALVKVYTKMYIYLTVKIRVIYHTYFLVIYFSTIGYRSKDLINTGAPVKQNV